jgi:lipoate-protein ligase A
MKYLDLTLPSAAENLALDESLLLEAEAGRGSEILRLWEWPNPTVILGAGCHLAEDVDERACKQDGVPIIRRSSGGGTVLLAAGCLCFSLILAYKRNSELSDIRSSIRYILGQVRDGLLGIHPGIELAGTSDLAILGRKFSGNSQQRKRQFLLHHGTILYCMDLNLIARYLRLPYRQPEYRRQRDHGQFLANLPANTESLKSLLVSIWNARSTETVWPKVITRQLVESKYNQEEWIRRR